jgi:hypothetical protein
MRKIKLALFLGLLSVGISGCVIATPGGYDYDGHARFAYHDYDRHSWGHRDWDHQGWR